MSSGQSEHLAVRAVTAFTVLEPRSEPAGGQPSASCPAWTTELTRAITFVATLASRIRDAGYAVQTLRIITNPFAQYLDTSSEASALLISTLQASLASAERARSDILRNEDSVLHRRRDQQRGPKLVPGLIREAGDLANTCLNVPVDAETGAVDADLVLAGTRVCAELGHTTPRGEGNFNFTINFNGPRFARFPAGFNTKQNGRSFVIGLEYPALLAPFSSSFSCNQINNTAMA